MIMWIEEFQKENVLRFVVIMLCLLQRGGGLGRFRPVGTHAGAVHEGGGGRAAAAGGRAACTFGLRPMMRWPE